jgi:Flp pilus assembly protein TadG
MAAAQDCPMSSPAASTVTPGALLRRFRRNRRGSAVVEFALIAPLFFALLFAIIETAFMFFGSQVLETITQNSARAILTGAAQTGGLAACSNAPCTQGTFKTYVCSQIPALFNCNGLSVDVESFNAFANVTFPSPVDANGNFNPTQYTPGASGQITVVKVSYLWPIFVTGLGYNIANQPNNKRLLTATAAFQNEPY